MALLKRKENSAPVVLTVVPSADAAKGTGPKGATPKKGTATPKRSDAQAARRTPIVASATPNRPLTKEEKAAKKAKDRGSRDEAYEGMKAGVEKHLPARDKGAQRRYVRQFIDARRNLAEWFMPVVFTFLLLTLVVQSFEIMALSFAFMLLFYALLAAAAIDTWLMWRKLKALLIAKFGDVERGTAYYAAMRAFQLRRMRLPQANVARGDFPK